MTKPLGLRRSRTALEIVQPLLNVSFTEPDVAVGQFDA